MKTIRKNTLDMRWLRADRVSESLDLDSYSLDFNVPSAATELKSGQAPPAAPNINALIENTMPSIAELDNMTQGECREWRDDQTWTGERR